MSEVTPELKKVIDKAEENFANMQAEQKKFNEELKAEGKASSEQIEKIAKCTEDLTKKIEVAQKAIARSKASKESAETEKKALADLNGNLRAVGKEEISMDEAKHVNAVMKKMIQTRGMNIVLTEQEQKSINGVVDPAGGYFMFPDIDTTLTKRAFDARGFINSADNKTTNRRAWINYSDLSRYIDSRYRSELDSNQNPTVDDRFKEVRLTMGIQYYPEIFKREFLEDDELNIESDILEGMRLGMIRKDAQGAIDGDGTNLNPFKGVLSYAEGVGFNQIERITSTTTGALDLDDILKLLPNNLKEDYHGNGSITMARQTYNGLLTLKDTAGAYRFDRHWDLFKGAEMTFFSYPVIWDAGMTTSTATGAQPIFFGDNREAYQVCTRDGFSLHKDDSQAETVKITARSRRVGGVKNFEAIKVLKIK